MHELKVTSWQLFGHDRLYVNLPDGTAIGWADLGSGTITVLHPRYRDAVTDALARQVPDMPVLGEVDPPDPLMPPTPPSAPRIPPLRRMRMRKGAEAGERGGAPEQGREDVPPPAHTPRVPEQARPPSQEREPVTASPGEREGRRPPQEQAAGDERSREPARKDAPTREPTREPWPQAASGSRPEPVSASRPEPASGPRPEPASGPRPEPVSASRPEPVSSVSASAPPGPASPDPTTPEPNAPGRRPELPALTPATDLSTRRPGTALRVQLGESGAGTLVRAATGALRRQKEPDPRRTALSGERRVGAELKRLTRHGWRVLHSVPLSDGTEIGHLLIGPGGVFAVHAEHHPQASVRIDDGTVRFGDGEPQPYALDDRFGAGRARRVLEAYCTFAVPVGTVLVFTGVTALDVVTTPPDVRVLRERQVSSLAPLSGALTPTQVERVYDVARNQEAWAGA
ncbi:NERD domain-containing protein [Streptomyces halstedii]|uniref:NERD domain-containing protein n=1 Tax=Streptomyces halstedii TaxID=1944 RepID=UPI0038673FB8|nr:NERD domain-containing protein [Streptomyces halstedii]